MTASTAAALDFSSAATSTSSPSSLAHSLIRELRALAMLSLLVAARGTAALSNNAAQQLTTPALNRRHAPLNRSHALRLTANIPTKSGPVAITTLL